MFNHLIRLGEPTSLIAHEEVARQTAQVPYFISTADKSACGDVPASTRNILESARNSTGTTIGVMLSHNKPDSLHIATFVSTVHITY